MSKKQTTKKRKVLGESILKPLVPKLILNHPMPCPWCLGTGKTYGKECPKCKGAKEIEFY